METIGGDLRQMQRTPLAPAHVEALRRAGAVARYPAECMPVPKVSVPWLWRMLRSAAKPEPRAV
jgi:hypothetical protein